MPLLTDKLTELADTLADLKDRIRLALTGEIARMVAEAVRDVVQAVLRREPGQAESGGGYYPTRPSWRESADPWADEKESWDPTVPMPDYRRDSDHHPVQEKRHDAVLALTAGVAVAKWWTRRSGNLAAGVGFGLLAAAVGMTGPVGRTALAAVATAAEILTVPVLLSTAADRLGRR